MADPLMATNIAAIFENGVLRPLDPLPLSEREQVRISVFRAADDDWLDQDYMNGCAAEGDATITLEQVRAALATIVGTMDDAIDEDRGNT